MAIDHKGAARYKANAGFPSVSGLISSHSRAARARTAPDLTYLILKRAIDLVLSSLLLLVLSPLLLFISLAIFAEDRGPILFVQTRVGKEGKPFRFYKFRSMVRNAEALRKELSAHNEANGPIFKMRCDPRITRTGRPLRKWSLDELPQLINVLRGDMSLVGPRPHLPHEVQAYSSRQSRRLSVQPGLVCLREVSGRSNLSFERWIEMDLAYIEARSLGTDLAILLRTVPAVLCGNGAY
jgi:lipopolysaccharide/colanic/teichoic acid biosynthesis glycosyltransferase